MFPLYDTIPHRRTPWLTLLIIVINAGVMFWFDGLPTKTQFRVAANYGFVPQRINQLTQPKLVVTVPAQEIVAAGRRMKLPAVELPPDRGAIYLSLLTMMFLHGGWFHLISNMWMLWIFGNNIEDRLGHLIYPLFYLIGGLVAIACHWAFAPESTSPVIGASGAVSAVLGAYAITYPAAKVRTLIFIVFIITIVDIPALVLLSLWFLMQLASGLLVLQQPHVEVSVAWWAHIGGFLAGLALMPLLSLGAPPLEKDWREEAETAFGPSTEENDER